MTNSNYYTVTSERGFKTVNFWNRLPLDQAVEILKHEGAPEDVMMGAFTFAWKAGVDGQQELNVSESEEVKNGATGSQSGRGDGKSSGSPDGAEGDNGN